MSDHSSIEWTDATWNPITGCTLVSEGCRHCYAARLAATRLAKHPSRAGLARLNAEGVAKFTGEVRFNREWLTQPLSWKRPRKIFVCAHGDLFAEGVPDEWIDQVFAVMALAKLEPRHTFQVLTKRPARMREYFADRQVSNHVGDAMAKISDDADRAGIRHEHPGWGFDPGDTDWEPLPNVWLGTSIEDQASADTRLPELLATPAAVRFVSAEPLLGPIDLRKYLWIGEEGGIDFSYTLRQLLHLLIVGGESGPGARPMHPDWARVLRDQCAAAGVPFFFKQWGEWTPGENVDRLTGTVETAHLFGDEWMLGRENLARDDGHIDDEPDLYRVGKAAAGRLLDGVEHNGMPARPAA
jgi:protein gp37